MLHTILNPMVTCFLSHNNNIYDMNGGPLLLSNRQSYQGLYNYILCILLNATDTDFSSLQIEQAILEFPIQRISSYASCEHNALTICACYYSESGQLITSYTMTQPLTRSSTSCNILQQDITSIINKWNCNEHPILQLYLSIDYPNLTIQLYNPRFYSTNLILYYTKKSIDPPSPGRDKGSMLSVCSKRYGCLLIPTDGIIPFDTIVDNIAEDITYDITTNMISFQKTGYYYIEWIINLRGCTTIGCLSTAIRNETTGEIHEFHTPCTLPLQLCGQHILKITNTFENYTLINHCDSPVQLSNSTTQASLIIFRI